MVKTNIINKVFKMFINYVGDIGEDLGGQIIDARHIRIPKTLNSQQLNKVIKSTPLPDG